MTRPITEQDYARWVPQLDPFEPTELLDGAPTRVEPPRKCNFPKCPHPAYEVKTDKHGVVLARCLEHR